MIYIYQILSFDAIRKKVTSIRSYLTTRTQFRIGNQAENGDIKPESRIAVSEFQTRPHAYFVTVRAATNPTSPFLLLVRRPVLNSIRVLRTVFTQPTNPRTPTLCDSVTDLPIMLHAIPMHTDT